MKRMVVIAGPYGVGKTKIMRGPIGRQLIEGTFVDPQEVFDGLKEFYAQEEFHGESVPDYEARTREKALSARFRLIRKHRSLTGLCSLGRIEDIDVLDAARKNNYQISFHYYGVGNWTLCRDRLRQFPGHWLSQITDEQIFGDYHRSLAFLPSAIPFVDEGWIYDVSGRQKVSTLIHIKKGRISKAASKLPEWIKEPMSRCL